MPGKPRHAVGIYTSHEQLRFARGSMSRKRMTISFCSPFSGCQGSILDPNSARHAQTKCRFQVERPVLHSGYIPSIPTDLTWGKPSSPRGRFTDSRSLAGVKKILDPKPTTWGQIFSAGPYSLSTHMPFWWGPFLGLVSKEDDPRYGPRFD